MLDKSEIKKGGKYIFTPKGLSDVQKEVTVLSEPVFNSVVNEHVVRVAELFGLCPINSLEHCE